MQAAGEVQRDLFVITNEIAVGVGNVPATNANRICYVAVAVAVTCWNATTSTYSTFIHNCGSTALAVAIHGHQTVAITILVGSAYVQELSSSVAAGS